MEENKKEVPVVDNTVEKIKIKKPKKKKFAPSNDDVVKVDLSKVDEGVDDVIKVDLNKPENNEEVVKVVEEAPVVQEEVQVQETPTLEEVTDEVEEIAEIANEAIKESIEANEPLPENIQALVSFMDETGGDLNDYVQLNRDYSELDNQDLLHEFYQKTKPHLNNEEIAFLLEDQFSYDEDVDEERD